MPSACASIVVVEDSYEIMRSLVSLLRMRWERTIGFSSSSLAEIVVLSQPPDLLITDYLMPLRSGADLVRALSEKGASTVPIFLTGAPRQSIYADVGDDLGFVYLQKPCSGKALVNVCAQLLSHITACGEKDNADP